MQPLRRFAQAQAIALVVRPEARERLPVRGGPRLSHAAGALLRSIQVTDSYGDDRTIQVPVERPLSVLLDGQEVASLWTLGASPEWLVLGYLWNQQRVTDVTRLESISVDWEAGKAAVVTRRGVDTGAGREAQQLPGIAGRFGTDGNGLVMQSDGAAAPGITTAHISRTTLQSVIEGVPQEGAIYQAAGSVHSSALFAGADLWVSVEDVSRRNAVDTIIGWMALHGIPGGDKILFTTGRLTAEVIAKAACSGIRIVVSRKGITATCHDLAARLGMTLFGHAVKDRYVCYAGGEHFDAHS